MGCLFRLRTGLDQCHRYQRVYVQLAHIGTRDSNIKTRTPRVTFTSDKTQGFCLQLVYLLMIPESIPIIHEDQRGLGIVRGLDVTVVHVEQSTADAAGMFDLVAQFDGRDIIGLASALAQSPQVFRERQVLRTPRHDQRKTHNRHLGLEDNLAFAQSIVVVPCLAMVCTVGHSHRRLIADAFGPSLRNIVFAPQGRQQPVLPREIQGYRVHARLVALAVLIEGLAVGEDNRQTSRIADRRSMLAVGRKTTRELGETVFFDRSAVLIIVVIEGYRIRLRSITLERIGVETELLAEDAD